MVQVELSIQQCLQGKGGEGVNAGVGLSYQQQSFDGTHNDMQIVLTYCLLGFSLMQYV